MVKLLALLTSIPVTALAQTVENPTLLPSGIVLLTVKSELPISLHSATLMDSSRKALDPIGPPRDIPYSGTNSNCEMAAPVNGPVFIPFNLPGQAPYSLTLKIPDAGQGNPVRLPRDKHDLGRALIVLSTTLTPHLSGFTHEIAAVAEPARKPRALVWK